ncbi:cytochrome-c peroxidase [Altibacter sp. HG106]|uniref:cytochrome-c peroxidase n=1 Tax=Altibacter sp. HG106 TaxID=3023937 RepID=UPI0023502E9C|nr:cytochrome c peroxidase [Altibacter sp. HG106]MDC7995151.1 cytochrome c peroxidase [Altibacter sp. HG106]
MINVKTYLFLGIAMVFLGCQSDDRATYQPTPFSLDIPRQFEEKLPPPLLPEDNPLTEEGVALGRQLFFDPILSADGTLACAGCHRPQQSFDDPRQFSIGIDGEAGFRNAMPLVNLAWNFNGTFNWDGSAASLEAQAFEPVTNPIEMHNTWPQAVASLQEHPDYPQRFEEAFGTSQIDSTLVAKALAQFERTLISGRSRFDQFQNGAIALTASEANGLAVFMDEERGDCFHCHGNPNSPLWTDNLFHNNGLDATFTDRGRGDVTGDPREFGLFKTPTLRNLAYTAPYMHDGRFETLDEVINHYSEGLVFSETIDPLMKKVAEGGVQLSEEDKADLKAFLLSLSDPEFITNSEHRPPR